MNTRAILAIVRKDLKVALQNKGVVLPIVILPLILFVAVPWIMAYASSLTGMSGTSLSNLDELLRRMPAGMLKELSPYNQEQQLLVFSLVYMLAPMFLIMPLMVSSVLAADSFAGEKERKTLEALLYSPTTDRELFTAKLLGRQYVRRLDVDLEVDPVQMDLAMQTLQGFPQLVISVPKLEKDVITMTLSGRESIPELLSILLGQGLRVYRFAPREADLEEVYFALHGGSE